MRRFILYAAAGTVLVSLLTTVLAITTHRVAAPPCPWCQAPRAEAGSLFDTSTMYRCRSCQRYFYGPARRDFSWADAVEEWLDETPVIQ